MNKKTKFFSTIAILISIITIIYILNKIYKDKELKKVLSGMNRISTKNEKVVLISDKYNRYLLKSNEETDMSINEFMKSLGWSYNNSYGRSSLYSNGYKEMLVKKIELLNGYCILEWLDEDYVKNRVI